MAGVRKRNHHALLPAPPAGDHNDCILRRPVGCEHVGEAFGGLGKFFFDHAWSCRVADPAIQANAQALWDETQETQSKQRIMNNLYHLP
jgi:hypothetical protein